MHVEAARGELSIHGGGIDLDLAGSYETDSENAAPKQCHPERDLVVATLVWRRVPQRKAASSASAAHTGRS